MTSATVYRFETDVARLLHIVTHALYSDREIFLRELIANASDACERLRLESRTDPGLAAAAGPPGVTVTILANAGQLVIADNGVGMTREELVDNLGSIAHSGAAAFLGRLSADDGASRSMIGQFGVGFYSAFMVADRVELVTRRAGDSQAWHWSSDGSGSYEIAPADSGDIPAGTRITLHLRQDAREFLEKSRLVQVIRTHANHIGLPVTVEVNGKGEVANTASALWTRPAGEISTGEYREFYRSIAHAWDAPELVIHFHAEGRIEYRALLFIPEQRPPDLFDQQRHRRIRLYCRRVLVTDRCDELAPGWARFLCGLVDSEDLPLNVSRELLQNSPLPGQIRRGIVRRLLQELEKLARDEPERWLGIFASFGAVMKEGICEDDENRDRLLGLARFHSTAGETPCSLADYVARMPPGQKEIYLLAGDDRTTLRNSPQLEGFLARGIEVLLLDDPVDSFWAGMDLSWEGRKLRPITRGKIDLPAARLPDGATGTDEPGKKDPDVVLLCARAREVFGDSVRDVVISGRLTRSAVCLSAPEGAADLRTQRLLSSVQGGKFSPSRVLELNSGHPVIRRLARLARRNEDISDHLLLLLDQARILEGEPPRDPAAFARRMEMLMSPEAPPEEEAPAAVPGTGPASGDPAAGGPGAGAGPRSSPDSSSPAGNASAGSTQDP